MSGGRRRKTHLTGSKQKVDFAAASTSFSARPISHIGSPTSAGTAGGRRYLGEGSDDVAPGIKSDQGLPHSGLLSLSEAGDVCLGFDCRGGTREMAGVYFRSCGFVSWEIRSVLMRAPVFPQPR